MTIVLRIPVWAMVLLLIALLAAGYYIIYTGSSLPVEILDTTISTAATRDGCTIVLGYKIRSDTVASARLGAAMLDPSGTYLTDPNQDRTVKLSPGTEWYYRTFTLTVPPDTHYGDSSKYDVIWSVYWDADEETRSFKEGSLTVDSPVAVRLPILVYHRVDDVAYSQNYVTTNQFRAQMAALAAYGYTPITCQQLLDMRAGLRPIPSKPIMLTFDDAYRNWLTRVDPVLAEHQGFVAVGFVPTSLGEEDYSGYSKPSKIANTDANEPTIDLLTWDDMRAMHCSGRWDFQSHSHTHSRLTQIMEDAALAYELRVSMGELERRLGKQVVFLAYPYGDCDRRVREAAWKAGYLAALTIGSEIEEDCFDKYDLDRVYIYSHDLVDYSGTSDRFFMRKVDPNFPLPDITVDRIDYLDPDENVALGSKEVRPGRTVKVCLTATNRGATVNVVVSLNLAVGGKILYDSHRVSPSQDEHRSFPAGATQTFEWSWMIPAMATAGQYNTAVGFHDEHYVFGYKYSKWTPAFVVSDAKP